MKTFAILILVLLVLGLYYYTDQTKEVMQKTGYVVKVVSNEVKEEGELYLRENILGKKETKKSG